MISILIPCFDYNAYPLVSVLEKQALMLKIDFEIICIDDGSFSLSESKIHRERDKETEKIPKTKVESQI